MGKLNGKMINMCINIYIYYVWVNGNSSLAQKVGLYWDHSRLLIIIQPKMYTYIYHTHKYPRIIS